MEEAGNTGMKCQNEINPITYRKIRNGINHNKSRPSHRYKDNRNKP
jgi:hypothetical protein